MRYRLTVAYDGTDFHGFAPNPGVRTVGGVLAETLSSILRAEVALVCAGRTDAGVHAHGQVVTFDVEGSPPDPARLQRAVNSRLAPEIVVREAAVVSEDFDARRSATEREYRYRIWNDRVQDPLVARTTWHVPEELDLARLRLACDPLIGEHDFSSFCRRPRDAESVSLVRRVRDARWIEGENRLLEFRIAASSFCHQMVRSLVGLMVEMGRGRRRPGEMMSVLRAKDRSAAGPVAPPHGLVLWSVTYEGWSSA